MANPENQNQLPEQKKIKTDPPDEILIEDCIHKIFTFLPIQNAIVASSLSPRYKTSWHHNRQFLFSQDLCSRHNQQNLASIVDHLFNSHKGDKIEAFELHIDPIGIEVLLKKWLQICTQKDLEYLVLYFNQPSFTIESNVFNALHTLKTLKVDNCVIELPKVLSGLQFLQNLSLSSLHITGDMFEVLIKHCKMLESIDLMFCSTIKKLNLIARENKHFKNLKIVCCQDLKEVKIDSPTLRTLFYHGNFSIFRIAQGMQLYKVCFYFTTPIIYIQVTPLLEASIPLEAIVKDLSQVSMLTTTPQLIEGMAVRDHGVVEVAEYCLMNMKALHLYMDGAIFCNPCDIAMFLENCPCLEKFYIDLGDDEFYLGVYWEMYEKPELDKSNHKFTQLKVVVLRNFKYLSSELELVKMILQRATTLEKLILIPPKINGDSMFKKEDRPKFEKLCSSWTVSSIRVTIRYYEKYVEKIFTNPTL